MKLNRSSIYSIVLIVILIVGYKYRTYQSEKEQEATMINRIVIQGGTMGTRYQVVYYDEQKRNFKTEIDALLENYSDHLSTYIPTSEIAQFNKTGKLPNPSEELLHVLNISQNIYNLSEKRFDPTVMPLVNLWGFGYKSSDQYPDTATIISTKDSLVGFDKVTFNDTILSAPKGVELGFGAIAKGDGVDKVGALLQTKGIKNYCITIGGENLASGSKPMDTPWKLLISYPEKIEAMQQKPYCFFNLNDKGAATSGPYMQEQEINGIKYSHTIDPRTGFPVPQEVLSITIIAENCMLADGIATVMSVMSLAECKTFLKDHPEFEALILYKTKDGIGEFMTSAMQKLIIRV